MMYIWDIWFFLLFFWADNMKDLFKQDFVDQLFFFNTAKLEYDYTVPPS